jgi:hypothetical protein
MNRRGYVISPVSAYHWKGIYRNPDRVKVELVGTANIRTGLIGAFYATFKPTDFVYHGLRLFKAVGGRGEFTRISIDRVEDDDSIWQTKRWVNTSTDRLLMPDKDYQKLLKKHGRQHEQE